MKKKKKRFFPGPTFSLNTHTHTDIDRVFSSYLCRACKFFIHSRKKKKTGWRPRRPVFRCHHTTALLTHLLQEELQPTALHRVECREKGQGYKSQWAKANTLLLSLSLSCGLALCVSFIFALLHTTGVLYCDTKKKGGGE